MTRATELSATTITKTRDPDRVADRALSVFVEQVGLLYSQATSGFLVTLSCSIVVVVVLWDVVTRELLLGWFSFITFVTFGRYLLIRKYRCATRVVEDINRWRALFVVGAAVSGVAWGLAGTVFFPEDSVFHQVFLTFLLGGIAAGAAPYLASVISAYIAFSLPTLLPFAVLLIVKGGNVYPFMGIMVLVFASAMVATAKAMHATITRSLQLRFENLELIDQTSNAKTDVERANVKLQAEIKEHKQDQIALHREKELAQVTLESIGDGVITTHLDAMVEYLNPVAEQLTGWLNADARGQPLTKVLKLIDETTRQAIPDPVSLCLNEGTNVRLPGHTLLVHRNEDREFSIEITVGPIRDRDLQGVGTVLVFHDVTEMRGMARRMSYQASHDALTGLINRHEFELRLTDALESARNDDRKHAMCYLDLDQFKIVNDMCGHVAGDELLRQLATQLQTGVRETDSLGRLGGDEFGVLLQGCPMDKARTIAEGLRQIVRDFRFAWQERVFEVGVSIGLVPITSDSGSLTEVLSAADSACYVAKDHGRDRIHVYEPDDTMLARRHGERRWVARIGEALGENRFMLYQQKAMPLSGKAEGREYAEILIRMLDKNSEPVPTAAFLPAAHRYNLMSTIDRWVLRTFCTFMRGTQGISRTDAGLYAINLSGQSLSDERFLDFVVDQLRQNSIAPENICFEISERAAIANLTRAMRFISALRDIGCLFALDDFGSGVSSFAYLKSLQVDFLKIDGSFIKDTTNEPIDYAMVEIINQIGHVMNILTIAESVEQKSVLVKLKELGVDYAQGFEITEPTPLNEYIEAVPKKRSSN
ncbi:MAG: EAL domain-containing protein [Gammaproteobacteria bacterium]|nr:EAL domain-containing protein [Gammaproteobacteria bacterium]